ncbi:MAG: hypothetical protein JW922_10215 [Paludibacteraceae bacterium]|nr:hypothetical protein [Paludibacteraceae bacterium]
MKLTDITDFVGMTNTAAHKPVEPEKSKFEREELGPKKTLFSWESEPKTSSFELDPRFKKTFIIIGSIILFLLVLMQEFMLILFVASLFFIIHALEKAPKKPFKYEISSHGIAVDSSFYYWDELIRYFVSHSYGVESIAVDVKEGLPGRLFLFHKKKDREKIIESMHKYLTYLEEEPLTATDRAYLSVMDKFELNAKK